MLILRALFVLLASSLTAQSGPSGPARVIDGDTLEIGGTRVRLHGIDAPERKQDCRTEQGIAWPCGAWVTDRVRAMLDGHRVTCAPLGTDRYGRILARCYRGGVDIAATLVAEGLAFAYVRYASDYLPAQAAARAADTGLWSGTAPSPEAFRHTAVQAPPSPDCAIKANISANGRILHLPGSAWYDRTAVDTAAGERWFCSVAQAQEAGWRPARG